MNNLEAYKMDGLGNDFIIFDKRKKFISLTKDQIVKISDRNSIGCDQVIFIDKDESNNAFLKFYNSDVDNFRIGKYDIIVSNPPYIELLKLKYLDKDLCKFEPKIALNGGIDGFSVIKKVVHKTSFLIKKNKNLIKQSLNLNKIWFLTQKAKSHIYICQKYLNLEKKLKLNFDDKKIFYIDQISYSKSIFFRSQSIFFGVGILMEYKLIL